jgi:hypothetical protein
MACLLASCDIQMRAQSVGMAPSGGEGYLAPRNVMSMMLGSGGNLELETTNQVSYAFKPHQ